MKYCMTLHELAYRFWTLKEAKNGRQRTGVKKKILFLFSDHNLCLLSYFSFSRTLNYGATESHLLSVGCPWLSSGVYTSPSCHSVQFGAVSPTWWPTPLNYAVPDDSMKPSSMPSIDHALKLVVISSTILGFRKCRTSSLNILSFTI